MSLSPGMFHEVDRCALWGEEQSCFGSVCPFFPRFGCVVSPLVTNQFILSLFRLSRAAWLLAEELRTFPERHRWYTGSRQHLCSGYTPPPCWKTYTTCSSPPPGETEPGWSPERFYSWRGDSWRGRLRFLGQRKTECEGGRGMEKNDKSDNLQEKKREEKGFKNQNKRTCCESQMTYLSRQRNWPKVSSYGTRNFVLSNRGRVLSRM